MCLCNVSAVVRVDATLNEWRPDVVRQTEEMVVLQWRDSSADHHLRAQVMEMIRSGGCKPTMHVIRRSSSLALFFICKTLSAVVSLRDQWSSGQFRDIVSKLFTFLSGNSWPDGRPPQVLVKRIRWPATDYERCLVFFRCLQGKPMTCSKSLQ